MIHAQRLRGTVSSEKKNCLIQMSTVNNRAYVEVQCRFPVASFNITCYNIYMFSKSNDISITTRYSDDLGWLATFTNTFPTVFHWRNDITWCREQHFRSSKFFTIRTVRKPVSNLLIPPISLLSLNYRIMAPLKQSPQGVFIAKWMRRSKNPLVNWYPTLLLTLNSCTSV